MSRTIAPTIAVLLTAAGCGGTGETEFSEEPVTYEAQTGGESSSASSAEPVAASDEEETPACDSHVHFATASAELSPQARQRLDDLARCLLDAEIDELTITGHADPEGTDEANQELGQLRGAAVAGYLRGRGLLEPDIEIRSAGENERDAVRLRWSASRRADIEATD